MARPRLELHEFLVDLMGEGWSVYFQPPEDLKISYPCLVYEISESEKLYADNHAYIRNKKYEVTIIDRNPDTLAFDKIDQLSQSTFLRRFSADDLNHFIFELYF